MCPKTAIKGKWPKNLTFTGASEKLCSYIAGTIVFVTEESYWRKGYWTSF